MTIQEIQNQVQQAPGSIYTREDVISLLNRITFPEAKPQGEVNIDHLIEILEESMENLANRRMSSYLEKDFNTDSYGDSLTVECEVTLDTSSFVRDAVEEVREDIEKLFEGPSSDIVEQA
jgi:hypothetical protein